MVFLDVHISDLRYAPIGHKSFLAMVHDGCTHLRLQVEMVGNSSSSNLFLNWFHLQWFCQCVICGGNHIWLYDNSMTNGICHAIVNIFLSQSFYQHRVWCFDSNSTMYLSQYRWQLLFPLWPISVFEHNNFDSSNISFHLQFNPLTKFSHLIHLFHLHCAFSMHWTLTQLWHTSHLATYITHKLLPCLYQSQGYLCLINSNSVCLFAFPYHMRWCGYYDLLS
jgi:hypothetical protein